MVVSFDTAAGAGGRPDRRHRETRQGHPRPAARRRHRALRRHLFRVQGQAAAGSARHKFRRAMVVLSDGDDNQSRYTRDQALEMAQKADAVIYAISTNITRIETDGDKVLKYFAAETGGRGILSRSRWRTWSSRSRTSPTNCATSTTSSTARSRCETDGLFHPIELRVKGRKDLRGARPPRLLRPPK